MHAKNFIGRKAVLTGSVLFNRGPNSMPRCESEYWIATICTYQSDLMWTAVPVRASSATRCHFVSRLYN